MVFVYRTSAVGPSGTAIGDIDVETEILLNENGAPVNYIIVNQGKPGDMYDESCNGAWILRKDIAENRQWNSSNVNDYANSTVHAYLNGDWLNRYDPEVAEAIKQVKIPYRQNSGSGGTDQTGSSGLSCKVFLLSGREVGFTNNESSYFPNDGAKLDYFISGNTPSAQQRRVANLSGSATDWWLRSPYTASTRQVFSVTYNGNSTTQNAYSPYGIRPTLILPFDFKLTDDQIVGVTA